MSDSPEYYVCQNCGDITYVSSVESYTEPCPRCKYKLRKRIIDRQLIAELKRQDTK